MSSISGRHFYRFSYLKSEHWQNLRLEKLASVDACCERCGHRDLSNDVHHLNYRKLYDVKVPDLVVLCRPCHDLVHEALDRFRTHVKKPGQDVTWKTTKNSVNWLKMGIENPTTANFRIWRLADKQERRAKKEALEAEIEAAKIAEKARLAKEAEEARAAQPVRDPILRDKMRKGFNGEETKALFVELRRAGFFKPSDS